MKNFTILFFLFCFALLRPQQSLAAHAIGGEIAYQAIGPGNFLATYRGYYKANTGIAIPQTQTFQLRSPGCNTSLTFTGTLQSNNSFSINGGIPGKCNPTGPDKVIQAIYTTTFTIPTTQPQCSEWILSVQECAKVAVANLPVSQNACLYVEAYLNNYSVALQTSSPSFFFPNSLVFNLNSPATYDAMARQDTTMQDSVVYTLKPALNDYNSPLIYEPTMSFMQPLPTSSGVILNSNTGQIAFTPNFFNSAPNALNAYTIVVEAAAFRRINGVIRKVSAAQRNLPVFIVNNPNNSNPDFINVKANGQPVQKNEVVEVVAGNIMRFTFDSYDANLTDTLRFIPNPSMNWPVNTLISFILGSKRPYGSITFNTRPSQAGNLYYFNFTVYDSSCPVNGVTTHAYGVRVLKPLGQKEGMAFKSDFTAFPNPFSQEITFNFNTRIRNPEVRIYNLLGQQISELTISTSRGREGSLKWHNAEKYPSGTYVAKLIADGEIIQVLKLIRQ